MSAGAQQEATRLVAEGMFTVEQAAAYCRMGKSWLYEEMAAGRLPYATLGRRRLIPIVGLREFVARAMVASVAAAEAKAEAKAAQDAYLNYGR